MDMAGNVIKTGNTSNQVTISELQKGNYFIVLTNKVGTYQAKFMKM
jgi:hypothetical protein